jgi:hypothetical protein
MLPKAVKDKLADFFEMEFKSGKVYYVAAFSQ